MIDPSILIQNAKLNKSGASGSTTNSKHDLLNQNSGFSNIFEKQIENVKTTSSGIESPENNNLLARRTLKLLSSLKVSRSRKKAFRSN